MFDFVCMGGSPNPEKCAGNFHFPQFFIIFLLVYLYVFSKDFYNF